jgi:hypothetical protein
MVSGLPVRRRLSRSDAMFKLCRRLIRSLIEWVESTNAEILEVSHMAGDDGQVVNRSGGSDHGIFNHMV